MNNIFDKFSRIFPFLLLAFITFNQALGQQIVTHVGIEFDDISVTKMGKDVTDLAKVQAQKGDKSRVIIPYHHRKSKGPYPQYTQIPPTKKTLTVKFEDFEEKIEVNIHKGLHNGVEVYAIEPLDAKYKDYFKKDDSDNPYAVSKDLGENQQKVVSKIGLLEKISAGLISSWIVDDKEKVDAVNYHHFGIGSVYLSSLPPDKKPGTVKVLHSIGLDETSSLPNRGLPEELHKKFPGEEALSLGLKYSSYAVPASDYITQALETGGYKEKDWLQKHKDEGRVVQINPLMGVDLKDHNMGVYADKYLEAADQRLPPCEKKEKAKEALEKILPSINANWKFDAKKPTAIFNGIITPGNGPLLKELAQEAATKGSNLLIMGLAKNPEGQTILDEIKRDFPQVPLLDTEDQRNRYGPLFRSTSDIHLRFNEFYSTSIHSMEAMALGTRVLSPPLPYDKSFDFKDPQIISFFDKKILGGGALDVPGTTREVRNLFSKMIDEDSRLSSAEKKSQCEKIVKAAEKFDLDKAKDRLKDSFSDVYARAKLYEQTTPEPSGPLPTFPITLHFKDAKAKIKLIRVEPLGTTSFGVHFNHKIGEKEIRKGVPLALKATDLLVKLESVFKNKEIGLTTEEDKLAFVEKKKEVYRKLLNSKGTAQFMSAIGSTLCEPTLNKKPVKDVTRMDVTDVPNITNNDFEGCLVDVESPSLPKDEKWQINYSDLVKTKPDGKLVEGPITFNLDQAKSEVMKNLLGQGIDKSREVMAQIYGENESKAAASKFDLQAKFDFVKQQQRTLSEILSCNSNNCPVPSDNLKVGNFVGDILDITSQLVVDEREKRKTIEQIDTEVAGHMKKDICLLAAVANSCENADSKGKIQRTIDDIINKFQRQYPQMKVHELNLSECKLSAPNSLDEDDEEEEGDDENENEDGKRKGPVTVISDPEPKDVSTSLPDSGGKSYSPPMNPMGMNARANSGGDGMAMMMMMMMMQGQQPQPMSPFMGSMMMMPMMMGGMGRVTL